MKQFNYFKKLSKSGNNFFSLMFIIPWAFHAGVLMIPTDYHGKTTEQIAPRLKVWGYTNKVRLRGLNLACEGRLCLCSRDFQSPGIFAKLGCPPTESFHEGTKNTKVKPSVFPLPQLNLAKSLEENKKNQSPENKNNETTAKQNPTKPTVSGTALLKELRDRVRRGLLASGTNDPVVVDQTLDSLPIEELDNRAFFFDGQKLKAGTIGSLGISQNSIARTYSQYLEPISVELGFKIEKIKGGYGGENLYKIRNDQQGVEFYLSLIGFGSFNSQTFIVLWEKDPRSL